MSKHIDQSATPRTNQSHVQGLNNLVIDAIVNITDIVESVHHRVNRVSGVLGHPSKERTSGITSLVYRGVRELSKLIGSSIDVPLKVLHQTTGSPPSTPATKAMRSALNGVLGDYLESQNNPLAIAMNMCHQGQVLSQVNLDAKVEQAIRETNGKLLIMVHGLCMNDLQWRQAGHDHGEALAELLGYTVLYLNYNSGRHIAHNGDDFSTLLESMVKRASGHVHINIIAHSMGGLVSRSAHQHAMKEGYAWPNSTHNLIFLGTPHHGAALEKTGNWLDLLLAKHPYTTPFGKLIQIRSAGITDLRHGNVNEQDWQQRSRFDFSTDSRQPTPLPKNISCFAVAGSIGPEGKSAHRSILGDGLVDVDSALGRHSHKPHTLLFKAKNQAHFKNVGHLQLLSDQHVYEKLVQWLS